MTHISIIIILLKLFCVHTIYNILDYLTQNKITLLFIFATLLNE